MAETTTTEPTTPTTPTELIDEPYPTIATSADTDKIDPALISSQGACGAVVADVLNPQYNSNYTSLSACLRTVIPVAAKYGLGFITSCQSVPDGKILAITKLFHTSGQWIQITLPMRPTNRGDSNQALGSILSYARRYSISSLFALRQADDDANAGDGLADSTVETPTTAADTNPRTVSPDDHQTLVTSAVAEQFTSKAQQKMTRYKVTFSDGSEAQTLSERLFQQAKIAENSHTPVLVTVKDNKKFRTVDLLSIDPLEEKASDSGDVSDRTDFDGIPF